MMRGLADDDAVRNAERAARVAHDGACGNQNRITAITGLLTPSGQGCSGSSVLPARCP
jgi:hypothetical protein